MSRDIRVGIDVGGTNTDVVVLDEATTVLAAHKSPTSPDVLTGIREALNHVLPEIDVSTIKQVMLGTTHPLNAVIRRQGLARVGILRLGAPATLAIPPMADWPEDLIDAVRGPSEIVRGGHEFDGTEITALDENAVRQFALRCRGVVDIIAVTGVTSPANPSHEIRAAEVIAATLGPAFPVSLGHQVGGIGLLERENSAILNAALAHVARDVVAGLTDALATHGISVSVYLTQNDGTLLTAEEARRRPILTVGSGPTNSMRGAAHLSGLTDAIVMDVGGTSTDVGLLVKGFPRESALAVDIAGVRTNYRMPDLISVGLGGGSLVHQDPDVRVGPDSVGYLLGSRALAFGGDSITLSDVSIRAGRARFGDSALLSAMSADLVDQALAVVDGQLQVLADRIKSTRKSLPLIAVGGGAHLIPSRLPGVSEIVRTEHADIANAIGAAIAEVSGTVDRNYRYSDSSREACLAEARTVATQRAIRAGADPGQVRIASLTEIPMTYMPGDCARVQVKAVGPVRAAV